MVHERHNRLYRVLAVRLPVRCDRLGPRRFVYSHSDLYKTSIVSRVPVQRSRKTGKLREIDWFGNGKSTKTENLIESLENFEKIKISDKTVEY